MIIRRRILQVLWSSNAGGAEVLLLECLHQFRIANDPNVEFHIVILSDEGPLMDSFRDVGYPVTTFSLSNGYQSAGIRQIRELLPFIRFLKKQKFDVIHVHASILSIIICGLFGRSKVIATHHGGTLINGQSVQSPSDNPFHRFFVRFRQSIKIKLSARFIDMHISISQFVHDRLIAQLKLNDQEIRYKSKIIYNGVNCNSFPAMDRDSLRHSFGLTKEHFIIGSVARLVPVKGVSLLIDAVAQLISSIPSLRLIIIGDGPQRHELEQRVELAGLSEHVIFAGIRVDVRSLYCVFDLFAFTSTWEEPFGMTIIEAMSTNIPVIAFNRGAIPEIIQNQITGILIPPESSELVEAVLALYPNEVLRSQLVLRARQEVEMRFSLARMCTELLEQYTEKGLPDAHEY